jgi:hypothetical protein
MAQAHSEVKAYKTSVHTKPEGKSLLTMDVETGLSKVLTLSGGDNTQSVEYEKVYGKGCEDTRTLPAPSA